MRCAPGCAAWEAVGAPGASRWPMSNPRVAVTSSGAVVAAFRNRTGTGYYWTPWTANPGVTAMEWTPGGLAGWLPAPGCVCPAEPS